MRIIKGKQVSAKLELIPYINMKFRITLYGILIFFVRPVDKIAKFIRIISDAINKHYIEFISLKRLHFAVLFAQ